MAIEPTNMARLCTDKWQPLWVKLDAHKYCQIFVSPYTGDYLYYYNNEWHNVGENDMYYYDRTRWVKVTDEGLKLQYSNKVRDFSVTPAEGCVVTLMTNGYGGGIELNGTIVTEEATITVPSGTGVSVDDVTLTIGDNVAIAMPDAGYHFVGWTDSGFGPLPATITEDIDVMAEFMDSPAWTIDIEWLGGEEGDVGTLEALYLTAVDPEDPFAVPQTGTAYFNTDDVYDAEDGFQRLEFTSNNQDTTFVVSENEDSDDPQAETYGYVYKMVVTYSGNAAPAEDIVITAKDAIEDWDIGVANVYVDEGA